MFIFGFFKLIIIGIIAFIIIIVSSIVASDWNFTKDEFINTYNTFLQSFDFAGIIERERFARKKNFWNRQIYWNI